MTLTPERREDLRGAVEAELIHKDNFEFIDRVDGFMELFEAAITDLLAEKDAEIERLRLFNGQVNRDLFGAIADREAAEVERDTALAKVAAVEALCDQWDENGPRHWNASTILRTALATGGDS